MDNCKEGNWICRTCLSETPLMIPIRNIVMYGSEKTAICDAIMVCASVQVTEGDGLPEQLCIKCNEELGRALLFRRQCEKTDAILRLSSSQCQEEANSLLDLNMDVKTELDSLQDSTELNEFVQVKMEECFLQDQDLLDKSVLDKDPPTQFLSQVLVATLLVSIVFLENEDTVFDQHKETCGGSLKKTNYKLVLQKIMYEKEYLKLPVEIIEDANAASLNLLPERSKERYEKEYEDFKQWLKIKNVNSVNEDVLLAYVNNKSEIYSPNTMWTKVSMLKLTLKIYDNIDITNFRKLFIFLKRKSENYAPRKANVLSEEQITKFLIQADDHTWLLEKVLLMFGIFGACKRAELVSLNVDDFENTDKNVLVTLRGTENKKSRRFVIPKTGLPFNAYVLYKKYADLRPPNMETRRFFIGFRNGRCIKQVVGIHNIGSVPKKIATFLKLENAEHYTGHTFRRSSATMLVENRGMRGTLMKNDVLHISGDLEDPLAIIKVEEEKVQCNPVRKYICEICNISYDGVASYEVHLETEHFNVTQDAIRQPQCNQSVPDVIALNSCPIDDDVELVENAEEIVSNANIKSYNCEDCNEQFTNSLKFDIHMKSHSTEIPFKHKLYTSRFVLKDSIKTHIQRKHPKAKQFKCELCPQSFDKNAHLMRHSLTHTGEKPYKCGQCGNQYASSNALDNHSSVHTGVSRLKCNICQRLFPNLSKLKTHLLTHTGERPFGCDACPLTFSTNGTLKQHMMQHTGEKPHKCQHCRKTFPTPYKLKIHLWGHEGEKPYKCGACPSGFKTKAHLIRHKAICMPVERPRKCEMCTKSYNTIYQLRRHKYITHANKK